MFRYVLYVLLLFRVTGAFAQTPVYRNFTHKEGLPSSETYCVIQDSRGYIWAATDRGVVKYDGHRFVSFTMDEGLPDNTVFEMFEDGKQRIWLNTYSARIGYLHRDSAYHYRYNEVIRSVYPFQLMNGLFVGPGENLWFLKKDLNSNRILSRIDRNGKISTVNPSNKSRVYMTPEGKCLMTGPNRIGEMEIRSLEKEELLGTFYCEDSLISTPLFATVPDTEGNFLLAADGKLMRVNKRESKILFRFQGELLSFRTDHKGAYWMGFRNKGLVVYDSLDQFATPRWLLRDLSPTCLLQDREGGVWVSTLESGLFYFFPFLPVSYSAADGLSTSKVKKLVVADNRRFILLANEETFLLEKEWSPSGGLRKVADSLIDMEYTGNNNLYIMGAGEMNLPPGYKRHQLGYTKRICIGQHYHYSHDYVEMRKYRKDDSLVEAFSFAPYSRIMCVFELSPEELLIGTLNGLYLKSGQSIRYLGDEEPLLRRRVSAIGRIDSGHLVIATIGYGIVILGSTELKKTGHYSTFEGLPSSMCHALYVKNSNSLWLATNRGVCHISNVLNPERAVLKVLDTEDGLISNEINDIRVEKGQVWIATALGVSVLPEQTIHKNEPDLPLYITGVSVNGKYISHTGRKVLEPGQNSLRFSFVSPSFWHPSKLTYIYRLQGGGDTNWYASESHSAVFNSLPSGDYVFQVGLKRADGSRNPVMASFGFTISPRFYQTWWFILLVSLLLLLALNTVVRYRVAFVRRQEHLKSDLRNFRDKALRNQMNPHFIYNTLNSLQHYILRKEILESASILAKFAQLMRLTFNNTSQDRVMLETDLDALKLYVELEQLRFGQAFAFHLEIAENVNPAKVLVPPLLIQPFVENAIVHGLTGRENGCISVTINHTEKNILKISIRDNGRGRSEAGTIGEKKSRFSRWFATPGNDRKYSGIKTTQTRIEQLWPRSEAASKLKITDLYGENNTAKGTLVEFLIPIYHDKNHSY